MGKCVTCHGLHILENDNSKINHSCVSPRMGCLEYQDVSIKVYLTYCSESEQYVRYTLIDTSWYSKQPILGLTQEWFILELSFSKMCSPRQVTHLSTWAMLKIVSSTGADRVRNFWTNWYLSELLININWFRNFWLYQPPLKKLFLALLRCFSQKYNYIVLWYFVLYSFLDSVSCNLLSIVDILKLQCVGFNSEIHIGKCVCLWFHWVVKVVVQCCICHIVYIVPGYGWCEMLETIILEQKYENINYNIFFKVTKACEKLEGTTLHWWNSRLDWMLEWSHTRRGL